MSAQAKSVTTITLEAAYDLLARMDNLTRHDLPNLTIADGHDGIYGRCYVVIAPLGDAVVLPIVSQDSAS